MGRTQPVGLVFETRCLNHRNLTHWFLVIFTVRTAPRSPTEILELHSPNYCNLPLI